jgi:hypothetical protein
MSNKMSNKKFPWRGAPDAGVILGGIAILWALSVVVAGFLAH